MLKTLRVTSLVTVILVAISVIVIVALGLKGDSEIKAYLAKPSVVEELKGQVGQESKEADKSSPLVALGKKVSLRFDPPPPPKPVVKDTAPIETARVKPVKSTEPPRPKGPTSAKFDLLATVVYKTAPEKSLALLQTAANKQEWFREGEKAGRFTLQTIRDGSVVFDQGTGKTEEIFVPAKPQLQSLLKGEKNVSSARPGSITAAGEVQVFDTDSSSVSTTPPSGTTTSERTRLVRPRANIFDRIQRVRSNPAEPSPSEKKEGVDRTIQGIQEIMQRQNDAVSDEEREKENEMWVELLKNLETEKKQLDTAAETKESSEKENP